MLERIEVRDFALIEYSAVDFSAGFTVFTGETGAGKSLVVDAIGFLFGARADTDVIRHGAQDCAVTGLVNVSRCPEARAWLESRHIEAEEETVLLRRELRVNGRSYAWIGGQPVTRSDLATFTSRICDIHGQHEHQSLLDPAYHLTLLDRFGGLEDPCRKYGDLYDRWAADVRRYREAVAEEQRMARERDFLAFTVDELRKAALKPGEDEALATEERVLAQHEKLFAQVDSASASLGSGASGGGGNAPAADAAHALRKAKAALQAAAGIDPRLNELAARLSDSYFEVEDIAQSLRQYRDALSYDPERLEAIQSRQAELKRLGRKYGATVEAMLDRLARDTERLEASARWESERQDLERAIGESGRIAQEAARALSGARKVAAEALGLRVTDALSGLGMLKAGFHVEISQKKDASGSLLPGRDGIDLVEFLIAPNPGEPPKALARIASGGELSRVALGVKAVLAEKDPVGILVFDEIDSGIGGEVAVAVGRRLRSLADTHQVLCVTHLASIAAMAETQLGIGKEVRDGRTVTTVERLSGRRREEEIARMLSGDPQGAVSVAHAAVLLETHQRGVSPASS